MWAWISLNFAKWGRLNFIVKTTLERPHDARRGDAHGARCRRGHGERGRGLEERREGGRAAHNHLEFGRAADARLPGGRGEIEEATAGVG